MERDFTLTDRIKAILLEADKSVFKLVGESHHLLYQFLRITAGKIAHVDAFYIGYFVGRQMMVFPYSFDGKEYYDPNKFKYNPEGLAAWILATKSPYRFSQDNGALLHYGKSFGLLARKSEDAISVPILEHNSKRGSKVIGIMSMQTYSPNSYGEDSVYALEWLAKSLTVVLEREREDTARRRNIATTEVEIDEPLLRPDNVVNQMLDKMQSIRRKAEALKDTIDAADSKVTGMLEELIQECQQRQTETIELFLRSVLTGETPLSKLSKQEQQVAVLLVEGSTHSKSGYSNTQLAGMLNISEDTVKTHLRSVYKKLDVSGRTGVIEIARNYLLIPRHDK